jgi:hypothetical protein
MKLTPELALAPRPAVVRHAFQWFRQFVERHIVGEVPDEIGLCEFDCRELQCTERQWAVCERRRRKGAEELFPAVTSQRETCL